MKIQVLDHGYVEFIEAWGQGRMARLESDDAVRDYERGIIEAARQSTQGSFRGWEEVPCNCSQPPGMKREFHKPECQYQPGDKRLLAHLYENSHNTPFEFAGMVIEVQAPIFIFREWHRHRTQSYNEMSARYAPLPDLYYIPDQANATSRAEEAERTENKQAGSIVIERPNARAIDEWLTRLRIFYKEAEVMYQESLQDGVPKELARLSMPVGHYSRMRASANLRNWLAFMTLRTDSKAQWEIQQYALAVQSIVETHFPRTWSLWTANL